MQIDYVLILFFISLFNYIYIYIYLNLKKIALNRIWNFFFYQERQTIFLSISPNSSCVRYPNNNDLSQQLSNIHLEIISTLGTCLFYEIYWRAILPYYVILSHSPLITADYYQCPTTHQTYQTYHFTLIFIDI